MQLNIPPEFRKMAIRAILTIFTFILVYLSLILVAGLLMALCVAGGIGLIIFKPAFLTLAIGLGLAAMGLFVMFFLVKFIFSRHVSDSSNMVEITREQQPELYTMIEEIVAEVKTDFPKKIYLTADVNAAVFYDSGFWSMFLPVRKNLMIGMGLVNTVTVNELKAILAHEFGHFSQRSMKIGSYVYNVNRVIYNMLYDNRSYENMIGNWAAISGYFAFFVRIGVRIIQGIQWVLHQMYRFVNLGYMRLSREMEFHADAVAAHVAGSAPLINSLRRLELAGQAYQTVIEHHHDDNVKSRFTRNLYKQQQFVMQFLARRNGLGMEYGLPKMKAEGFSKYRSKLVIKNQWDSHPETEDRVAKLLTLNIERVDADHRIAAILFRELPEIEQKMAAIVLPPENENPDSASAADQNFENHFVEDFEMNCHHKFYNSYYDIRQPVAPDFNSGQILLPGSSDNLFSNESVQLIYDCQSLESDLQAIKQIFAGGHDLKTFVYDGVKYDVSDSGRLIDKIEIELQQLKLDINRHDQIISGYFCELASAGKEQENFRKQWDDFQSMDKTTDESYLLYRKLIDASYFIQESTGFEEILQKLDEMAVPEKDLKNHIRNFLTNSWYKTLISEPMRRNFELYIAGDLEYFSSPDYNNENLKIFFTVMNDFQSVVSKSFQRQKKQLLEFQVGLINAATAKVA